MPPCKMSFQLFKDFWYILITSWKFSFLMSFYPWLFSGGFFLNIRLCLPYQFNHSAKISSRGLMSLWVILITAGNFFPHIYCIHLFILFVYVTWTFIYIYIFFYYIKLSHAVSPYKLSSKQVNYCLRYFAHSISQSWFIYF